MTKTVQQFGKSLQSFLRDEEGAQIIEYALIVAVVSLGLILLMQSNLVKGSFTDWITRVSNCLKTGGTCA